MGIFTILVAIYGRVNRLFYLITISALLIFCYREFRPPTATKKSVYTWNDQIEELSSLLSEVNQRYMQQVYEEYEKVCEKCANKATQLRVCICLVYISQPFVPQGVLQSSICSFMAYHLKSIPIYA